MEVGEEGDYLPIATLSPPDSCIKMGSDESHFNVSVESDGQNQKTVSTNHNLFEEKGEPKRYRMFCMVVVKCCLMSSDVS